MRKILITIGILALAVAGYFAYNYFTAEEGEFGKQQKTASVSSIYLGGDDHGTTTETYLFTTGSPDYTAASTWSFPSSRVDEIDRNILVRQRGSSTASILNWYWEYSYDNIDWFRENVSTSTPDLISSSEFYEVYKQKYYKRDYNNTASSTMDWIASSTIPYASTSPSWWDDSYVDKFQIPVPNTTANYSKLTFWETGASSTIWMSLPFRDIGK